MASGSESTVFDTPRGCRVGVLTCYDNETAAKELAHMGRDNTIAAQRIEKTGEIDVPVVKVYQAVADVDRSVCGKASPTVFPRSPVWFCPVWRHV